MNLWGEAPVAAKPVSVTRAMTPPSAEGATRVDMVLTLPPMQNNKSEFRINGGERAVIPGYYTTVVTDLAERWIRGRSNERPWAITVMQVRITVSLGSTRPSHGPHANTKRAAETSAT